MLSFELPVRLPISLGESVFSRLVRREVTILMRHTHQHSTSKEPNEPSVCVESSVGRKAMPCAVMWSLWQNRVTHHHVKFNASCGYTEILLTINGCREGMRGCVLMHPKFGDPGNVDYL